MKGDMHMTIKQSHKIDRKYKNLCNISRFVRDHINRTIGTDMLDYFSDKWDEAYPPRF